MWQVVMLFLRVFCRTEEKFLSNGDDNSWKGCEHPRRYKWACVQFQVSVFYVILTIIFMVHIRMVLTCLKKFDLMFELTETILGINSNTLESSF